MIRGMVKHMATLTRQAEGLAVLCVVVLAMVVVYFVVGE